MSCSFCPTPIPIPTLITRCTSIVSHNANFKISRSGKVEPHRTARETTADVEAALGGVGGGGAGYTERDGIQVGKCERTASIQSPNGSDAPASSRACHHINRTQVAREGYGDDNNEVFRSAYERRADRGASGPPNRPACEVGVSNSGGFVEERESLRGGSVGSTVTRKSLRCGHLLRQLTLGVADRLDGRC